MKIKVLLLCVLSFSIINGCRFIPRGLTTPHYQASAWESRGVGGGGALFVPSISPHNGVMAFLSTDMSAVFQTTNYGASWRTVPYTDIRGGVFSVVRFTSDPDVMYALNMDDETGNNVFLKKTTDGGLSWQTIGGSKERYI
jgi:hypothetical protein